MNKLFLNCPSIYLNWMFTWHVAVCLRCFCCCWSLIGLHVLLEFLKTIKWNSISTAVDFEKQLLDDSSVGNLAAVDADIFRLFMAVIETRLGEVRVNLTRPHNGRHECASYVRQAAVTPTLICIVSDSLAKWWQGDAPFNNSGAAITETLWVGCRFQCVNELLV